MTEKPQRMIWNGMPLIKISDVPGFADWLSGQTLPYVNDDDLDPCDWAFEDDYIRFVNKKPIID